jgi:hypothetical protein
LGFGLLHYDKKFTLVKGKIAREIVVKICGRRKIAGTIIKVDLEKLATIQIVAPRLSKKFSIFYGVRFL